MIIEDLKQLVVVRSDTQTFDGIEYRRSSKWPYFERFGKRLHRAVWEWHNGPIQSKFQIHHLDENRENNQIDNLEMISEKEHKQLHQIGKTKAFKKRMTTCAQCGNQFEAVHAKYCSTACSTQAWRKSGAINEWRSCVICGTQYVVTSKYRKTATCSQKCKGQLISNTKQNGR